MADPGTAATSQQAEQDNMMNSLQEPVEVWPVDFEWAKSLVGRDWEVYWKQETAASCHPHSTSTTSLAGEEVLSHQQDADSSTDAIQLTPVEHGGLEVATDDKEAKSPDDVNSDEPDEDDSAAEHEEDWYEAKIISFDDASFCVSFVGDGDKLHQMHLTPQLVRPSASAWIKRTRAMLAPSLAGQDDAVALSDLVPNWEQSLPPDTSMSLDATELASIQQAVVATELPEPSDSRTDMTEQSKLTALQRLLVLVRQQLYLQTKLVAENKKYSEFLVECLNDLQAACVWFLDCWKLTGTITKPSPHSPAQRHHLGVVDELLGGGRSAILFLQRVSDTSPSAATEYRNKKRKIDQALAPSRRPKRQRKLKTPHDDNAGNHADTDASLPEQITEAASQLPPNMPWFAQLFADMLCTFRTSVVAPLTDWQKRANLLCDAVEMSKDCCPKASQGDDLVLDQSSDKGCYDNAKTEPLGSTTPRERQDQGKSMTYEDVLGLIHDAEQDLVVRHFDVVKSTQRLLAKKTAIDEFSRSAWDAIGDIFLETDVAIGSANDSVSLKIRSLIKLADSEESEVCDVEPVGPPLMGVSRTLLCTAFTYRQWFLDLLHAEKTREQAAFIKNTILQYRQLPPFPDSGITSTIRRQFTNLLPRVQALESCLINCNAIGRRYQALLDNRPVADAFDCEGFCTLQDTVEALRDFSSVRVICIAEELLNVRRDILDWKQRTSALYLKVGRLSFLEIEEAHSQLVSLRRGVSPMRLKLLEHVRAGAEPTSVVHQFASLDINFFCSEIEIKVLSVYKASSDWKAKADVLIDALQASGNPLAGNPLPTAKLQSEINLNEISELVADYGNHAADFDETLQTLVSVQKVAINWSSSTSDSILADNRPFNDMQQLLGELECQRPKGIVVEPSSQVFDLLMLLLSWHASAKEAIAASDLTSVRMLVCLVKGLEIIEEFANHRSQPFTPCPRIVLGYPTISAVRGQIGRILSVSEFRAHTLCEHVLRRLIEEDESEGNVLLILLDMLWCMCIEEFVAHKETRTLAEAKALLDSRPLFDKPCRAAGKQAYYPDVTEELRRSVSDGDSIEATALNLLDQSKALRRDSLPMSAALSQHLSNIQGLASTFKAHSVEGKLLLSSKLTDDVEQELNTFSWLAHAARHHLTLGNVDEESHQNHDGAHYQATRIPYNELILLYETMPAMECAEGELVCILRRVKSLHAQAAAWQRKAEYLTGKLDRLPQANDMDAFIMEPGKAAELPNDPVLIKVSMPGEHDMQKTVKNIIVFEKLFDEFLAAGYSAPDNFLLMPSTESIVRSDGSTPLFCFIESRHYHSLKSTMAALTAAADRVHANVPGKLAFLWIQRAVEWIDKLRVACVSPISLGRNRIRIAILVAQNLLTEGARTLLDVPEDLRSTLVRYGVSIYVDQDVVFVKPLMAVNGPLESQGMLAIRWGLALFRSFKRDVGRTGEWNSDFKRVLESISTAFHTFNSKMLSPFDPVCVLEYLRLRDIVNQLLIDLEQLVVFPDAATVSLCHSTKQSILGYLTAHATREILRKHAEISFMVPYRLVENSSILLDSLIKRRSLDRASSNPLSVLEVEDVDMFRTTLRCLIDKTFQNAATNMGLSDSLCSSTFSSMKAWEVESALYSLYPATNNSDPTFALYRDQGRALKRALDDPDNLILCIQVLTDAVGVDQLVRMTSDDLASQKVKEDRAQAAVLARQSISLNVEPEDEPDATVLDVQSWKTMPVAHGDEVMSAESAVAAAAATPIPLEGKVHIAPSSYVSPSKPRSPGSLGELVQKASYRPPPPPPSLASLTSSASGSGATPIPPTEQAVTALDGSTRFHFEVASRSRRFTASLLVESDPENMAHDWITPRLCEVARVPVDEFSKFVHSKLASGRNHAMLLRVFVDTEADQQEYHKFCKMYEEKARIAMFNLNEWAKLYLVTPRFHKSAMKHVSFSKPTSPYALVITKRTTDGA